MKPPIYLTDPEGMLKARLNQPRATSEQLRAQEERLRFDLILLRADADLQKTLAPHLR